MPAYETMGWPMGMMGDFWAWLRGRPHWLDVEKIVKNVSGCQRGLGKDSICVMVGSQDVIMDMKMCKKQVAEYGEVLESQCDKSEDAETSAVDQIAGVTMESKSGVRLIVVDGAGHHVQNGVQKDYGAAALLDFVQQC
jgi:hypothetical protein